MLHLILFVLLALQAQKAFFGLPDQAHGALALRQREFVPRGPGRYLEAAPPANYNQGDMWCRSKSKKVMVHSRAAMGHRGPTGDGRGPRYWVPVARPKIIRKVIRWPRSRTHPAIVTVVSIALTVASENHSSSNSHSAGTTPLRRLHWLSP